MLTSVGRLGLERSPAGSPHRLWPARNAISITKIIIIIVGITILIVIGITILILMIIMITIIITPHRIWPARNAISSLTIVIIITRPKLARPSSRDRGARIKLKRVHFGVFSTSRFAPPAFSLDWILSRGVPTEPLERVIIFGI